MRAAALLLIATACPALLPAQAVPLSQLASVRQRVATTDISVEYRRPTARGRTLFGPAGVVRPGRVWTPGADSATRLVVSRDVEVAGHPLKAGRYSLWMIPQSSGPWTLIVSDQPDLFHLDYPGETHDVFRAQVQPDSGAWMDALAFYFPVVASDSTVLRLHWGTTILPFTIRTR